MADAAGLHGNLLALGIVVAFGVAGRKVIKTAARSSLTRGCFCTAASVLIFALLLPIPAAYSRPAFQEHRSAQTANGCQRTNMRRSRHCRDCSCKRRIRLYTVYLMGGETVLAPQNVRLDDDDFPLNVICVGYGLQVIGGNRRCLSAVRGLPRRLLLLSQPAL